MSKSVKVLILVLSCTLVFTILIGCSSSEKSTKEKTKSNDKSKILIKNVESKEKDTSDNGIKQNISGNLGQGEMLQDMSVKDKEIDLKINLGNETNGITMEDLAKSRYSSLTDYLLDTGKYDIITVDFVNVGKINMNISEAVSKKIAGKEQKYFPLEKIAKKFQKH